jgi:hypothetical protein
MRLLSKSVSQVSRTLRLSALAKTKSAVKTTSASIGRKN